MSPSRDRSVGRRLVGFAAVAAALGVGVALGAGVTQLLPARSVQVQGLVQYEPPPHPAASPAHPEGHYIESSAFGRIYLRHPEVERFRGLHVSCRGALDSLCVAGPCVPLVRLDPADPYCRVTPSEAPAG